MATVNTAVPINSSGHCANPDTIQSVVDALDLIVYTLTPASAGDDISGWAFDLFLTNKQGGGLLNLTLALPAAQSLSALVLPTLALGTYYVNLKISNVSTGASVVIDPAIIRQPK